MEEICGYFYILTTTQPYEKKKNISGQVDYITEIGRICPRKCEICPQREFFENCLKKEERKLLTAHLQKQLLIFFQLPIFRLTANSPHTQDFRAHGFNTAVENIALDKRNIFKVSIFH